MTRLPRDPSLVLSVCLLLAAVARAEPRDVVTYAGGPGPQRFVNVFELSDATVLVSGSAPNLNFLPDGVKRTAISAAGISASGGDRTAFLLRLSPDLKQILEVAHLPPGITTDIRSVRTTSLPGARTGALYISGVRDGGDPKKDGGAEGYFIGRLNGNFVDASPTALEWVYNVPAVGSYKRDQPWDVGSDGKVYLTAGEPFGKTWGAIYRLTDKGQPDVVEFWRFHLGAAGPWIGSPASRGQDLQYSAISLKVTGRGCLRSWDDQGFKAVGPDGNGGRRTGRWPLDFLFAGPFDPRDPEHCNAGPGYTGLSVGANDTLQVGAIVVDRRTDDLYFGFSVQSRLPNERLGVEPAVVAMSRQGSLKWWSRLYTESPENSLAHKYIDALAIDYSRPAGQSSLVVAGRCFSDDKQNFWRGDRVARSPGKRAFQSRFDGAVNNFFLAWLGRLALADGSLLAATYVGEYAEGPMQPGTRNPYADPILDQWLDHEAGVADLAMTRLRPNIEIDQDGRVYVLGVGRRVITTTNAYQKMLKPEQGLSSWAEFVRVYQPDFSSLAYSSILTGKWNPGDGVGGGNTALVGLQPVKGGVLVAGFHSTDRQGILVGNPIPVQNVVPWGRPEPAGEEAILARFHF